MWFPHKIGHLSSCRKVLRWLLLGATLTSLSRGAAGLAGSTRYVRDSDGSLRSATHDIEDVSGGPSRPAIAFAFAGLVAYPGARGCTASRAETADHDSRAAGERCITRGTSPPPNAHGIHPYRGLKVAVQRGRPTLVSMAAAAKGKKGSKAVKRKKASKLGTGGGGGSGAGFGAGSPSANAAVVSAREKGATSTRTSNSLGELPDDDFATFPPLSPDTLRSVMGVDVFDLPVGGVSARDIGQPTALPFQVLECLRNRHGLPDFGGGREVLDAAYASSSTSSEKEQQGQSTLLFPGLKLLHAEPPVIGVDDFFTVDECDAYVSKSLSPPHPSAGSESDGGGPHIQRSATLGADVDSVAQRTSTTWFHRFSAVPELMAKASALVGVPFEAARWEEAQMVRYRPGEKFTWHLDALPPSPELASKGGQRVATLLVYLTDLPEGDGGATAFRDLGPLRVRPRKGSALLFFPSLGGAPNCPFDIRTLHAGEMVRPGGEQDKWIAQLWLRESAYTPTVPQGNKHADAEAIVASFDASWRGGVE